MPSAEAISAPFWFLAVLGPDNETSGRPTCRQGTRDQIATGSQDDKDVRKIRFATGSYHGTIHVDAFQHTVLVSCGSFASSALVDAAIPSVFRIITGFVVILKEVDNSLTVLHVQVGGSSDAACRCARSLVRSSVKYGCLSQDAGVRGSGSGSLAIADSNYG